MLNLQKNDVVSLNLKKDNVEELNIGLGWDTRSDLDVHAILRDEKGIEISRVYFGKLESNGVRLSGDNRTGEGDGDDEVIFLSRDTLPKRVKHISIYVDIYSGSSCFGKIKGGYIRLFKPNSGTSLAKSELDIESVKEFKTVHFADINTEEDVFKFKIIMEGGYSLGHLKSKYKISEYDSNVMHVQETKVEEPKKKKRKRFFGLF